MHSLDFIELKEKEFLRNPIHFIIVVEHFDDLTLLLK